MLCSPVGSLLLPLICAVVDMRSAHAFPASSLLPFVMRWSCSSLKHICVASAYIDCAVRDCRLLGQMPGHRLGVSTHLESPATDRLAEEVSPNRSRSQRWVVQNLRCSCTLLVRTSQCEYQNCTSCSEDPHSVSLTKFDLPLHNQSLATMSNRNLYTLPRFHSSPCQKEQRTCPRALLSPNYATSCTRDKCSVSQCQDLSVLEKLQRR